MSPGPTRLLLAIVIPVFIYGCVTTTTATQEKWAPEQRAEAHVELGMNYLRKGQFETAESEFDTAITIYPKSDTAYHGKALLSSQIGDNAEATKFFARAVSLNPGNFKAANDNGIHLCQQNQIAKGIKQLKRVEADVTNDQVLATQLGLGVCNFRDKQYEKAETYFRLVLIQSPSLPQALLPMAEIYFERKDYLHSRGFLERFFGSGSISERSLYLATMVEIELNDELRANQYRRELNRRFPLSEFNIKLEALLK
jgi:type IV pilus assembly protein PilF